MSTMARMREKHDSSYSGGTVINREVAEFRVYKEWVGIDGEPPEISLHLYDKDTELPTEPIMRSNCISWNCQLP